MAKVGIIDADLIGRKKHRFPNLACMKLSAFHKDNGDDVVLLTDYSSLSSFSVVYVSKVFTDTTIPSFIQTLDNVVVGGTGFFYDNAQPLPDEIEHHFPDYHLYDKWLSKTVTYETKHGEYAYYTDYSIGFLTRGCFRQCEFCVNKGYQKCVPHSPIEEFLDDSRKKICLLDDNFFACSRWKDIIESVKRTKKRFQFKQGLDERLLTEDKVREMATWKYDGDFIFAFDNIADRYIVEDRLSMFRKVYPNEKKHLKFYVLCGFDRCGAWDDAFFERDLADTFERIRILSAYGATPYIMRFEKCYSSRYSGIYSAIAQWCNQPNIFHKFTFREFCQCKGMSDKWYAKYKRDIDGFLNDGGKKGAVWRYMEECESMFPQIASEYFDIRMIKQ